MTSSDYIILNANTLAKNLASPTIIGGDKVNIVWFTNVGTINSNYKVGFRASTDNRQTFDPMTNVSNTDNYDSVDAEISAEGDNVMVSYR